MLKGAKFYSCLLLLSCLLFCPRPLLASGNYLQVECFAENNQHCHWLTAEQTMVLDQLDRQQFLLQIKNAGDQLCQLKLQLATAEAADSLTSTILKQIQLAITNGSSSFYSGEVAGLLTQPLDLGLLEPNSSQTYQFDWNVWWALYQEKELNWRFDILLNFACAEQKELTADLEQTSPAASQSAQTQSSSSAMAWPTTEQPLTEQINKQKNWPLLVLALCLLLILVKVIFFVIMKHRDRNSGQAADKKTP